MSFRAINETTWPLLRGGSVLSSLFARTTESVVEALAVCAGHVAVVVRGGLLLAVFDAVPDERKLSTDKRQVFFMAVMSEG